jgi:hypothetical protein
LHAYPTTALGASEVNLLELANAYRTITSGSLNQPHVIRKITLDSGEAIADSGYSSSPANVDGDALSLIQEGLRGVGSTYGPEGITAAVRIGGRLALPVFKEIVFGAYREKLVGPVPRFPTAMEERIDAYLSSDPVDTTVSASASHEPIPESFPVLPQTQRSEKLRRLDR